jgi:predicted helicase
LFDIHSVGIVTARDGFTIHHTADEVRMTIQAFLSCDDEEARKKFDLGKDARDWKVSYARSDLTKSGPDFSKIAKISYRPFDTRYTYYTGKSKGFHCMPRGQVMGHFLRGKNVGLCFNRRIEQKRIFTDILVFEQLIQHHSLSLKEVNKIAPLYLYPEESNGQQSLDDNKARKPNLNDEIVRQIAERMALTFTPEKENKKNTFAPIDILDYIYAVLHSPKYRETYKEFLKIDFPRVPYPKDKKTFRKLAEIGAELRTIHLLENPKVERFVTSYPKSGDNIVTRKIVKKDFEITDKKKKLGRIWINDEQYFDNIPVAAWEFHIGGYQPAQKWLKDRKARELAFDDILHYQKIIVALCETEKLMKKTDRIDFM